MRFSEEDVYLIGIALSLVISLGVWIPTGRMMVKWCLTHTSGRITWSQIAALIFIGFTCWLVWKPIFYYPAVIAWLAIGTLLEAAVLAQYYRRSIRLESAASVESGGMRLWVLVVYQLLLVVNANFILAMGCTGFMLWFMPDVAVIGNGDKGGLYDYKTERYFAIPFEGGMRPGGSYVDNLTDDSIYRVVVHYGYLGEEIYNYYGVPETYPPHAFSRMASRADHLMDTIAPIMLPSYGRLGRYRTQRIYLTDKGHLEDFRRADLSHLGIKENRLIDSIREYGNRTLRENPTYYRAYKMVDPFPYPRLRRRQ